MILKKKPRVGLKAYPPAGYRREHVILDEKENWWTLADQYGFASDPWVIILFNFGTRDPREVNWFLEHAVGTTRTTDGKNYSFTIGNKIYIPPRSWKPDYDELLRRTVLTVLARPELNRIQFNIKSYVINVLSYRDIANAVIDRAIQVRYAPTLKTEHVANYHKNKDMMRFDFHTAATVENEAVILHEATHAALDMAVADDLRRRHSEVAAYIAQCMYAWIRWDDGSRLGGANAQDPLDGIFADATEVAKAFLAGTMPPGPLVNSLYAKIGAHPWYRATHNNLTRYNGIKRP